MIRSLRLRLLIATSAATAILLALFGIAIDVAMRHQLLADYDASLLAKAKMLSTAVEQHGDHLHVEFTPKDMPEFYAGRHSQYFELWSKGKVVVRSASLAGDDLPVSEMEASEKAGNIRLPMARHGRAAVLTFMPIVDDEGESRSTTPEQRCILTVAGEPFEAERTLKYLGGLLLASCVAAIGVSGAVLLWVVSRGIRPVGTLGRDIDGIQDSDLSFRLRNSGVPTELSPVIEKTNALLARLQHAFSREKAFTADVAHELRTPLAGLMTTLEVCRSRRREGDDYEIAIDECLLMIDRMQTMVETLLLLSRADAGHLSQRPQSVAVVALLHEMWGVFEDRAETRHLYIEWSGADECLAQADPSYLRIVFQNLLDNAVSYVNEGGQIRIRSECKDDRVVIEIANAGSAIHAADADRIFDRFWRADSSRADSGIHCGLGMALSKQLVESLAGTLSIKTTFGGMFIVTLSLPSAQKNGHVPTVELTHGHLV